MIPLPYVVRWAVGLILAAPVCAAELQIREAVELTLPTESGAIHAVERSQDLSSWTRVESTILGDGQPLRRYFAASADGPEYYRMTSETPRNLQDMLGPIRDKRRVPALGAVLIISNRVVAMGVVGVRRQGASVEATLGDKWHHGSLTKSMTATAAGVMVERGLIQWSSTVGELLGPKMPTLHAAWKPVTLDQLLRHQGGAHSAAQLASIWSTLWNQTGSPQQQREVWLNLIGKNPPPNVPGQGYNYSNAGYVLAGMMLEQAAGKPWEDLMAELVFRPLQMDSAGFGVPATPRFIDQPWGHQWSGSRPTPIPPGPDGDNPAGMGPAGTVHCTLLDLAKYAAFHAMEGRGPGSGLISPGNFTRLHEAPSGETYAYGWSTTSRPWAGGRVLSHSGSNVQWFSNLWVAPLKQAVLIAVTNIGDNTGSVAMDTTNEVITALIVQYLR